MERCIEARYVVGFDEGSKVEKDSSQFYVREGRMMKYRAIKLISLRAVYEAGDKGSMKFREVFERLFRWCFRQWGMTMRFFAAIDFNVLGPLLESRPDLRDFLLVEGFIEEVEEEMFYSVGDRFMSGGSSKYILAIVGVDGLVQLIRSDGKGIYNYAAPPMSVGNVTKITKKEFEKIAYNFSESFTKIWEEK